MDTVSSLSKVTFRGEGLGKTSQGPVDFVKVGVKKDTAGVKSFLISHLQLGTNKDQFEKWWEKVYNETAKNIGEDAPKPKVCLIFLY